MLFCFLWNLKLNKREKRGKKKTKKWLKKIIKADEEKKSTVDWPWGAFLFNNFIWKEVSPLLKKDARLGKIRNRNLLHWCRVHDRFTLFRLLSSFAYVWDLYAGYFSLNHSSARWATQHERKKIRLEAIHKGSRSHFLVFLNFLFWGW